MSKHRGARTTVGGVSPLLTVLVLIPMLALAVAGLAFATGVVGTPVQEAAARARITTSSSADVAGSAVRDDDVAPRVIEHRIAPRVTVAMKPKPKPKPKPVPKVTTVETTFQVGTLNILGSNHARNGLDRAAREAQLIRDRGIDIIGMQEVQRDQRPVLERNLPGYRVWPGDALGRQGYRVQIAYRTDRFAMVDGGGVQHTFDSQTVPIPWMRLRDLATGGEFHVIASHNSPRDMQGQREASTRTQASLVNELESTGLPVLLVGDFNEHESFFCRIAASTGLVSANGGRHDDGCVPPPRPIRIDWVLGTGGAVDFSGYHQDGTTIANRLSDHYLIYATAQLAMTRREG
jgi:endonuclease/exonuclease/phosphatase family metal-dependent hydrolase